MKYETIQAYLPYGGGFQIPNRIVVHAMGEYILHNGQYLYAPALLNEYKLSAHILIRPDGTKIRCRNDDEIAYHAMDFNENSLGIEFLVEGEHDYGTFLDKLKTPYVTFEQYESGVESVRDWLSKFRIRHMDRHCDLSPGRKVDPGAGFPWGKFRRDVSS